MRKIMTGLLTLGVVLLATPWATAGVSFTYQGRVKAAGHAYTGQGLFKFAIYAHEGLADHIVWSNAELTIDSVPESAIPIDVADGVFTVQIGDTTLPNMDSLDATIFNSQSPLFLRVWFDDGVHGFEALSPDSPINNPNLLGLEEEKDIALYVNASTGNDHWSGLKPTKPKRTIQAAIDALPSTIKGQALILVADGFYPESVRVQNIQLSGRAATLTLRGNLVDPSLTRIGGGDTPTTTVAARARGLEILNQAQSIAVEGFQIDTCSEYGVFMERSTAAFADLTIQTCETAGAQIQGASSATFHDLKVLQCARGINSTSSSQAHLYDSEVAQITYWGIMASYSGQAYLYSSTVHHTGESNVIASGGSLFLSDSEFYQGGTSHTGAFYGIRVGAASTARIIGGSVHDQAVGGIIAMMNGTIYFYGSVTTIQNCPIGLGAFSEGLIHNSMGTCITFINNTQTTQTGGGGSYLTTEY